MEQNRIFNRLFNKGLISHSSMMCSVFIVFFIFIVLFPFQLSEASDNEKNEEVQFLKKLSIEDLIELNVTSVSKKEEKLLRAPAAIYVITNEDIRRSGVTSIPEALRMVPGLSVAKLDSNKWVITSRGFANRFADKLLVLIDGRSVYTPIFSGVFWDIQDMMLEDVDRIEVIRGPGATLWGANAVNGIINIISKNSKDTQEGILAAGIGTYEKGFVNLRQGWKTDNDLYFRIYGKYFNRDNGVILSGEDGEDNWNAVRGGFRMDFKPSSDNSFTLHGDIYDGDSSQTVTASNYTPPFYTTTFSEDAKVAGGNLLFRWDREIDAYSDLELQLYYDRTEHSEAVFKEDRDTFDIDFQHRFQLGDIHELVWGVGYRNSSDDITNTLFSTTIPSKRTTELFSGFIQDQIMLVEDTLDFTIGTKYEHNDFTGSELQPGARLLYTPHEDHSFWASVSRAVKTIPRSLADSTILVQIIPPFIPGINPSPFPIVVEFSGNKQLESSEVIAYEMGYKTSAMEDFFLDISLFYNEYDKLFSPKPIEAPVFSIRNGQPVLLSNVTVANTQKAETYGFEASIDWIPHDRVRFKGGYTYLNMDIKDEFPDGSAGRLEGSSPQNQVSLRSMINLSDNLELDIWLRYVDKTYFVDSVTGNPSKVNDYTTLDMRLGWEPIKNLELSIIGQNLLEKHHTEYNDPWFIEVTPTDVERSIYGKITLTF